MANVILIWGLVGFTVGFVGHLSVYGLAAWRWSLVAGCVAFTVVALGATYLISGQYDVPRQRP